MLRLPGIVQAEADDVKMRHNRISLEGGRKMP
jgi:hypothetical protein